MGVRVREKVKDSGEWWVFIAHQGRRKSLKIGSKTNAEKVAEKIQARLILGESIVEEKKPAVPTLTAYFQQFQRTYLKVAVRENTQKAYERNFRLFILPRLGKLRLDQITRPMVEDLVVDLIDKEKARGTIRLIVAALQKVLNRAIEHQIIIVNPATKLGVFLKTAPVIHGEVQPLTHNEVIRLLQAAKKWTLNHYPMFLLAIHTGMRIGEIIGLKWEDIDFKNRCITVRRTILDRTINPPKSGKNRRIDMSDALIRTLSELKKQRQEEWLKKGQNEIPEWVFCKENGSFLTSRNMIRRRFSRALAKADLDIRRFHDLRHTFATLLFMQGESPVYVKEQCGHSSISITVDIYGHWMPGFNRQAMNQLPTMDTPLEQPTEDLDDTAEVL